MKQLYCIFLLALTTSIYTSNPEKTYCNERFKRRRKLHATIQQKIIAKSIGFSSAEYPLLQA